MLVFETISALQEEIATAKSQGLNIGFVPTMGALHQGHLRLVQIAAQHCDLVVVSIFVNPTQFNNADDLLKYPKTLQADLELIQDCAHIAFAPDVNEMYPTQAKKTWDFGLLSSTLEGHYRPGHFDGVCTIVEKLFEAVRPDFAYFGKKDYQQLAVIQALVEFEKIPVKIIPCNTVRDPDGLAMSSRNLRLTPLQRQQALLIYQSLAHVASNKNNPTLSKILEDTKMTFDESSGMRLEYLALVDAKTFEPVLVGSSGRKAVLLIAAYAGEVRLIDNLEIEWT
jgi:pantoate--beta-alanine ligase